MTYKNISGVYFQEGPNGALSVVNDPTILNQLKSGALSASTGSLGSSQITGVSNQSLVPQSAQTSQSNYGAMIPTQDLQNFQKANPGLEFNAEDYQYWKNATPPSTYNPPAIQAPPTYTPPQYTAPPAPTKLEIGAPPSLESYSSYKAPPLTLPEAPKAPDLVGLSQALDYAVNLAKTNRNSLLTGIMQPAQGTAVAGDFSGILNNLNAASVSFVDKATQPIYDQYANQFQADKEKYVMDANILINQYNQSRQAGLDDITARNNLATAMYNQQAQNAQNYQNQMYSYNTDVSTNKYNADMNAYNQNYQAQTNYGTAQNTRAQNVYDTNYTQGQTDKTAIQAIALELAKDGASQDIINAITNAGTKDSAIAIASGYLSKKSKNTQSLKEIGGNLYQVTQDKDGVVTGTKMILGGATPIDTSGLTPDQKADPFIQKLLATAGGKALTDTPLQQINKGLTVLGQLGALQTNINDTDTGPIVGLFRGANPWDTNAQTIKAQLNAVVPNLARGIYGEVGVLTDNDIKNYSKTIGNLTSTNDVNNAIMYITLDLIGKSIKNTLEVQAAGGRDVSRFVDIYTSMESTKNSILSSLPKGGTKSLSELGVTKPEEDLFDSTVGTSDVSYEGFFNNIWKGLTGN